MTIEKNIYKKAFSLAVSSGLSDSEKKQAMASYMNELGILASENNLPNRVLVALGLNNRTNNNQADLLASYESKGMDSVRTISGYNPTANWLAKSYAKQSIKTVNQYSDLQALFVKQFKRQPNRKERRQLLAASVERSNLKTAWRIEQRKRALVKVFDGKNIFYVLDDSHKRELSARLKRSDSVSGSILTTDKDTSRIGLVVQTKAQRYRGALWSKYK